MDVHVISKQDPAHHEVPLSSSPNRRSHLRPPPSGLTYAMLGTAWKWWDTYPVPRTAPAPYNDPAAWGIVPAWGYATVLESTMPNLPAGTSIFGYWPASGHAVDLQLTPRRPHDGHWTEVSPHRRGLFWLCNQYTSVVDKIPVKDPETLGWECAVRTIWTCGYLLSEYVFTPDPAAHPPLHPCPGVSPGGSEGGGEGGAVDRRRGRGLSHAVVISLGASTKTGRSFAHNLTCRPAGTGPLAFLQVTSAPAAIADATTKLAPPFPTKTVSYSDIAGAVEEWLASKQASKIVLVNFGSRDGGVEQVLGLIQNNPALKAARLVFIGVGLQQKVYSVEEFVCLGTVAAQLGIIQVNTSSIMEAALGVVDPRKFYDEVDERWNHWLVNRESAAPDLRLVWGKGVVGGQGLE
ncbi:DUF2855 family protein [Aspergillus fijiensis CBS 313.89]|uniref:Uncharacterized protein n=1 Tax=Aspergillus fijiensis CBS 313.89 TaxID=1448319 RepID=A0A8G1RI14_9EURO|nr:uncharacterized protein BO72DRAFT_500699 [Aspergillus fijiensis CBS 313.89]RAK72777.1 hypothetical protein BO72DRAFT_500699 [Aspergillus fijiensis CBS 313.89]